MFYSGPQMAPKSAKPRAKSRVPGFTYFWSCSHSGSGTVELAIIPGTHCWIFHLISVHSLLAGHYCPCLPHTYTLHSPKLVESLKERVPLASGPLQRLDLLLPGMPFFAPNFLLLPLGTLPWKVSSPLLQSNYDKYWVMFLSPIELQNAWEWGRFLMSLTYHCYPRA